jgi:hypothetical protein
MLEEQKIQISIKKSTAKKLKYLESFDKEILDIMVERLYEKFKTGEK